MIVVVLSYKFCPHLPEVFLNVPKEASQTFASTGLGFTFLVNFLCLIKEILERIQDFYSLG